MGEVDSLCEEIVRLWSKQYSPSSFQRVRVSTSTPTELLETPLPQEQSFSQGRGRLSHPNNEPNEPKSACSKIVPEQQTGLDLSWRSIQLESFTPLATWNKPSLCVIVMLPNYLWLTNYLGVNTIYSQSACLWCHTRILILCTTLLHFP